MAAFLLLTLGCDMLSKETKKAINDHAKECYPLESCGVIVNDKYVPCRNIAPIHSQFEISPEDLIDDEALGDIQAYVHSHPDGTTKPSVPDLIQMGQGSKPWVITDGRYIATHNPKPFKAPLLGRDYYHGLLDCYTLVKDYYQRELNITLSDYERQDAWWENASASALYLDNFDKEGFMKVSDIRQHDVILTRYGRTEHVNHAVIFLGTGELISEETPKTIGDSLILHHPYNRLSVREIYGDQWIRRTDCILRHKDLM